METTPQTKHGLVAVDFVGTIANLSPSSEFLISSYLREVGQPRKFETVAKVHADSLLKFHYSSVKIRSREERKNLLLNQNKWLLERLHVKASPNHLFEWFEKDERSWVLLHGASREIFSEISGKCRRFVVASNFASNLPEILDELRLLDVFDHVYASQIMGVEKPSVEFFTAIQTKESFSPNDCLMVGDSHNLDVQPSLAAGWKALLMAGDHYLDTVSTKTNRIASFRDLASRL